MSDRNYLLHTTRDPIRTTSLLTLRSRLSRIALALLVPVAIVVTGCTDDSNWQTTTDKPATSSTTTTPHDNSDTDKVVDLKVVASTSWSAAFVRAAGVTNVSIVAPVNAQHPPDYDPRPSDLASIADADFVVLGGFEGFADKMTQASGTDAEVLKIKIDNSPETIRSQVRLLAEKFGTTERAERWIKRFDIRIMAMQRRIYRVRPTPAPRIIAHAFMAPWATFAGAELVGTFGPKPVTPTQLAEFTAAAPAMIFDNAHVNVGDALADLGAPAVELVNFPSDSLDLLDVYETNTRAIIAAYKSL